MVMQQIAINRNADFMDFSWRCEPFRQEFYILNPVTLYPLEGYDAIVVLPRFRGVSPRIVSPYSPKNNEPI